MTANEFTRAEIDWAQSILAKPVYTMPNGRSSHEVAYEALNNALDRAVDECLWTADGRIA